MRTSRGLQALNMCVLLIVHSNGSEVGGTNVLGGLKTLSVKIRWIFRTSRASVAFKQNSNIQP